MKNTESLRRKYDFKRVYVKGKSLADYHLVLYCLKNGTDQNRLGISVSKKVGNSVVRSRVTRLIKENYRLDEEHIKKGYDLIFIARVNAKGKDYGTIHRSVIKLLKRHSLYQKPEIEKTLS